MIGINDIMENKSTIGKAVIAVGGAFGAYKLFGWLKDRSRKKQLKEIANSEMEVALENATTPTIDDLRATEIAKALYEAMDGAGTDESLISDILVLRNRFTSGDIIKINNAFGYQEYGTFGSPLWGSGEDLNLVGWLKKELSNTSDLYKVLQTKFTQAGIYWD